MSTTLDLFAAVEAGNAQSVEALLVGGASPDQFDRNGRTPLIAAIQSRDQPGFKDIVAVLLAAGARVDLKSFNDWTPLMHAASLGHSDVCEMLLGAGADPNAANFKGRTALMVAAYHLQGAALALLLQGGAAAAPADAQGRTAIDFLRRRPEDNGQFKRCEKLLKAAGAKKGKRRIRTRGRGRLRHFTADELTQSRHPPLKWRKFMVAAMLLALFAVSLVHEGLGILVALVGAALLLCGFPSILQLPYLLLAPRSERHVEVSGLSDDESTAEVGAGQLDAVSNFLRLGWGRQIQMLRARQARLTHTRSHLASIGLAAAIVLSVVGVAHLQTGNALVDALVPAAVTLVALLLEGRLRNSRLKAFQANWDKVAAEINLKLAEAAQRQPQQQENAFVLYLRTFGVTGLLNIGGIDFETSIAYNLTPMMPMIALGHPGEAMGAGRILTTDEHWKEEILRLVENASRIMLIPSHREGTQWEIARLKEMDHFGKTVFAMPPALPFGSGSYADEWNRAAFALTSIGLTLPLHYAAGLLFKLGPEGGIVEHAPLQAHQFLFELAQLMQNPDQAFDEDADEDGEDGGDNEGGDDSSDGDGGGGDGGGDGGP